MRIDRVVLGRWVPRLALWQLALASIYCIADAAQLRPDHAAVPWHLYPLRLPAMLLQSLPVATAAATAHTITSLRRNGEWLGATAAGLSVPRLGAPMLAAAFLVAAAGLWLSDSVVPACAAAFRAGGGGSPPGAVALPALSAAWRIEPGRLIRTGTSQLVVIFPSAERRPSIEPYATGDRRLDGEVPAPTDLSLAALALGARRSADPLPYEVEAVFRPVTAASTLLLCWLMLALIGRRNLGPRASAGVCVLGCLGSYAVVAASFNLALAGALTPGTAGLLGVGSLAGAALLSRPVWRQ